MVFSSGVQNALDLIGLALRPRLVHRASVVTNSPEDGQKTEHDNGLLVDNIELVADRGNRQPGTGREDGGFRDQAVAW